MSLASPSDHNHGSTWWQSTWTHRAWFAAGCITIVLSLLKSITALATNPNNWVQIIIAYFAAYILVDLESGVYHWLIDNYGSASTHLFGSQIEEFQSHHKFPKSITRRELANNLQTTAFLVTLVMIPIHITTNRATIHAFLCVFAGCVMFSQQFHAWAHSAKSQLPPLVVALQDVGLLVSRLQHAKHHCPPYDNNYCIISGMWNKFLDQHKVFESLEKIVYVNFGVRPRSWKKM